LVADIGPVIDDLRSHGLFAPVAMAMSDRLKGQFLAMTGRSAAK
jgi:hypothetical protein